MPSGAYQIFTSFCDNCGEECHEDCGELLDVPHKFLGDEPGFYCIKCLDTLPRFLYPRIPSDGIPRNVPKQCDDGTLVFERFMEKRKKLISKEKSKKNVFAGALVMQREHRPQDACVAVLDLILI
jgi:hypothetical protein